MFIEDYKSNSFSTREKQNAEQNKELNKEKKVQKVISGPVTVKKKSELRKFFDSFVQEDINKVKNYAISDVIIPNVKKVILDIVNTGLSMIFFGDAGAARKKSNINGTKISYQRYWDSPQNDGYKEIQRQPARSVFDFDDIVLDNRADAETVLMQLEELIDTYGFATVADLYDSLSITSTNHCDNNYGWYSLKNASCVLVRGGYKLVLPKVVPINQ